MLHRWFLVDSEQNQHLRNLFWLSVMLHRCFLFTLKTWLQVLDHDKKNVTILVQRALLYESMEKYKLGAEDLRMVLKIDPGNRIARSTVHRLTKMAGWSFIYTDTTQRKKNKKPSNIYNPSHCFAQYRFLSHPWTMRVCIFFLRFIGSSIMRQLLVVSGSWVYFFGWCIYMLLIFLHTNFFWVYHEMFDHRCHMKCQRWP